MSSVRRKFTALTGALALTVTLGSVPTAGAQTGAIDPSSLGPEGLDALISVAGSVPVGSVAGSLAAIGSADIPLDGPGSSQPLRNEPRPVDPSITSSEFIEVERTSGAYEYWLVTSAAMQREVILEVVPSRVTDQGSAPVLYMLDGVDAPEYNSGWNHQARIADRLEDENVHVVVPTGAYASYYADWENADETLGYNKWETFLTQELPGIVADRLDTEGDVGTNGNAGIGGISMGGQAAMHLAATYPELYQGVMSFSGYYSTMDQLGYQTVRGTIETRGGDVNNLWGPHGSEQWQRHDTVSHAEDLDGTAVYFSAGSGVPGPEDYAHYDEDSLSLFLGVLLESGVAEGTRAFERALDRAGVEHHVDYADTGLHNWPNFLKNFDAGWGHIKGAIGA